MLRLGAAGLLCGRLLQFRGLAIERGALGGALVRRVRSRGICCAALRAATIPTTPRIATTPTPIPMLLAISSFFLMGSDTGQTPPDRFSPVRVGV